MEQKVENVKNSTEQRDKGIMKIKDIFPILTLIVMTVFFQSVSGGKVLTILNFSALFNEVFMIVIITSATVFIISQGNNDLSIAGNVGLCCAVAAYATRAGSLVFALPAALITGTIVGMINGLIVTKLKIESFIATIAMSFVYKGILELILPEANISVSFDILKADQFPIKLAVVFSIVIVAFFLFTYSSFGKKCRAIGSRKEVALQSGVNVDKTIIMGYMLVGLFSGVVAFFSLARSSGASLGSGSNLQFNALQAILLGGASLTGGSGTRFRFAVIGSIIMAILVNGMSMWGLYPLLQQLIRGMIFLVTVALSFDRKNIEVLK